MLAKAYDVSLSQRGMYPAWESKGDDFARSAKEIYERLTGRSIEIVSIHAGLECALFAKKIKDLEAISIGPDLFDVHTTSETLSISSTQREWQFIKELIRS
jgi:dipeptidase D